MTILRMNGDEWRNQPGKRLSVFSERRCRERVAAAKAQAELVQELMRPLIPPHKRLKECGR